MPCVGCKDLLIVGVLVVAICEIVRGSDASRSARAQILEGNLGLWCHTLPPCVACTSATVVCTARNCKSADLSVGATVLNKPIS